MSLQWQIHWSLPMFQRRSQASTCDREDFPLVDRFFLAFLGEEGERIMYYRWSVFTDLPSVCHERRSVVWASVSWTTWSIMWRHSALSLHLRTVSICPILTGLSCQSREATRSSSESTASACFPMCSFLIDKNDLSIRIVTTIPLKQSIGVSID